MYEKGKLMFIFAETPLHPGAGSGYGGIDLPIQREKFTDLPILASSGIKGALRDFFEKKGTCKEKIFTVFGPDEKSASENAGALSTMEGRLFLFPVRSLKGVFAYLTCPLILKRFRDDLESLMSLGWSMDQDLIPKIDKLLREPIGDEQVLITEPSKLVAPENKVVLEEFAFNSRGFTDLTEFAKILAGLLPFTYNLEERLAIVSDNTMADFVLFSTEVFTRNRIDDDKGTVAKGALWTEEYLPRDTLLYSLLFASKPHREHDDIQRAENVLEFIEKGKPTFLWLGGDTTVGKGLARLVLL